MTKLQDIVGGTEAEIDGVLEFIKNVYPIGPKTFGSIFITFDKIYPTDSEGNEYEEYIPFICGPKGTIEVWRWEEENE